MALNLSEVTEKLESIVDQSGLSQVIDTLAIICTDKADHIETNWQDKDLAEEWRKAGFAINNFMASKRAQVIINLP